jgi:hypothetical protein
MVGRGVWNRLYEVYRGEIERLSRIVRVTIAMTNWYIRHHPLRRPDEEMINESGGRVHPAPAIELDAPPVIKTKLVL